MKITILSPSYPYRGGIANFTDLLFSELKKNHKIIIYNFKRLYPNFLFPGKTQYETNENINNITSFEVVDSINPLNWISIGNKIKNEKPDYLIIAFWLPFFAPCLGTISQIVKKNNFTKIITICHNVIPHEKRFGDIAFTKYLFNNCDKFVLLSSKVENDLQMIKPGAKFITLYHPVYSHFGDSVDKSDAKKFLNINDEKVILFFGLVRKYKGLDILLNALQLLKDKLKIKLIIAGEFYENEEKYITLIDELGLKENVKLYNEFIPTAEVKYYFSAADAVVLPYRDATQSGIVQVANNFLKPVIATNVGALPEVVENNATGYLVEKENPEKLAQAILKYYNENKEEEFSKNISERLEKISWKNFTNELINFIEV
ncbi:MAG: hypothetical protein A2068_14325 [Ignavibacteria bacterium GWB2_35_6b]|nr:MAG: hypothetical protein A2068_14325 [Ignavibacteria bacterium GWB2_35_6b]